MAGRGDAFIAVGAAASAARIVRKGFSARVIARVGSTALRKGMHSGNRTWLYVAAAASAARVLHKYAGRQEEIFTMKLRPGESFEIREIRPTK
jgi:hypothetical protein